MGGERRKKSSNYKERLNRQYLPPCYMETGAFVVSKASVVTEKQESAKSGCFRGSGKKSQMLILL
jgi:CMP-N-acetylneuraminic acid synthetase